jgi:hypothetical protein
MNRDPKLVYVIHEGTLHHVSDFASWAVKHRPDVLCPDCRSTVILKLGERKAHHVAHKPDSLCLLTKPETVLHLNTKAYLHSQLINAQNLYINQYCTGWIAPEIGAYGGGHKACHGERERRFLWVSGWDRVEVESFVESRKPDIVFYRNDKPVAAIEVKVTHAVDERKRIDLERSGLPWLEVEGKEDFYEGVYKWTPDKPLPYVRCEPHIPERTCDHCLRAPAEYSERVYEAIDKDRVERRKEKERREAYERWRKEEIVPRISSRSKPDKINLVKILRDESGDEIKYSVIQANNDSDTVLIFENQVLASFPFQTTEVWKRLMDVYREHRNSLGIIYNDVTGWEPLIQVDTRRATML